MGASSFSMGTHSSLSQGIFITSSSSPCSIVIRFQLKHYPVLFIRSTCRLHSLSLPWPLLPSPFLKAAHPTRPLRLLLQQDVNKAMMENSRLPLSMDHLLLWPSAKHPPVAKRTSCPQSSLMVSLPTLKAALVPSLQTTNSNSMVLLHKLAHSTLQASQSARMVLWLYDRAWAAQCEPVFLNVLPCGSSGGAGQQPDGQPTFTSAAPPVSQIGDGQPQATTAVNPPI